MQLCLPVGEGLTFRLEEGQQVVVKAVSKCMSGMEDTSLCQRDHAGRHGRFIPAL